MFLLLVAAVAWIIGAAITAKLTLLDMGLEVYERESMTFFCVIFWPFGLLFYTIIGIGKVIELISGVSKSRRLRVSESKEKLYDKIIAGEPVDLDQL